VKDDDRPVLMPSEVSSRVGFFDRFAGRCAHLVGRAAFFTFCVVLVVIWMPSIFAIRDIDTWQLIINTITTIITFLMVALLQNSQTRSDQAIQHKLNAIADGLADLMAHTIEPESDEHDLHSDLTELRDAVGLEERESTSHNADAAKKSSGAITNGETRLSTSDRG
jgi:low affinity Fe/Cu permease